MVVIESESPGIAWRKAYDTVMSVGSEVHDDGILLKEVIDMFIIVKNGGVSDKYIETYADPKMITWMVDENFGGNKPVLDWGYCYGMRLTDFRGVNQVQKIIDKLKSNPESKSATINFMDPSIDFDGHMPCIVALDFKIRNDRLDITGFFRSQDIGKKFYADILALAKIQTTLATALKCPRGSVKIFISSAHVYEQDFKRFTE